MEENSDGGEDLTPFWLQSSASSVFFSSELVIFILLLTAVLFLFFVGSSALSFSTQIFKPYGIIKSWDSLNVVLVLVAVVFGFLNRNNDEDNRYSSSYDGENQESMTDRQNETQKSNPSTPNKWYNDNTIGGEKSNLSGSYRWNDYSDFQSKMEYRSPILRRNSSSYPDLREFSSTHLAHQDLRTRFDDERNEGSGRVPDPSHLHRRHRSLEEVDHPTLRVPLQTTTRFVDTLVNKSMQAEDFTQLSAPPPRFQEKSHRTQETAERMKERSRRKVEKDLESLYTDSTKNTPPPPAPPPPPPRFQEKSHRTDETAGPMKERSRRKVEKDLESLYTDSTENTPPPPAPPPPPQEIRSLSDRKSRGSGGSSNATKDFLNSFYHKKKKKQRQKSVDNLDLLLHQTQAPLSFQLPPSPPPSPPLPSAFQNLFSSKKHKRKRTITVTVKSPSPAPPPPPEPPTQRDAEPEENPSSRKAPYTIDKRDKSQFLAENSNSGGESPLNRVPPPPPLPPFFKKPAWKFVLQGDYVRIDSGTSSRSGSPDLDELDSDTASEIGNAAAPPHTSPPFCASPDVNTKAESFITNFRAKLKLEKDDSMKRSRALGLSSLGPGPGPSRV